MVLANRNGGSDAMRIGNMVHTGSYADHVRQRLGVDHAIDSQSYTRSLHPVRGICRVMV